VQKNIAPEKAQTEAQKADEKDLPELDTEFLETLGGFKSLDEFKVALRENIQKDKDAKELNKRRSAFVEDIVSKTTIALPTVLISHELDRLQAQFEGDLQRVGSDLNAYLKSINKTSEAFLEELKPQAEQQAKLQLILNKIAEEEKLEPSAETVEAETKHLMEHHKDVNESNAKAYITMQLRNQQVFDMLEKPVK
jgi:trigger factor